MMMLIIIQYYYNAGTEDGNERYGSGLLQYNIAWKAFFFKVKRNAEYNNKTA